MGKVSGSNDSQHNFENSWKIWDERKFRNRKSCALLQTVVVANFGKKLTSKIKLSYLVEFIKDWTGYLHYISVQEYFGLL